jgi:hypothetical protein
LSDRTHIDVENRNELYEDEVLDMEPQNGTSNLFSRGLDSSRIGISKIGDRIKNIDYKENAKTFQVILSKTFGKAYEVTKSFAGTFARDVLKVGDGSGLYLKGRGHVKSVNWRLVIFLLVIAFVGTYITVNTINENRRRAKEELEAIQTIERVESEVGSLVSNVATLVSSREKEAEKDSALSLLKNKKQSLQMIGNFPDRVDKLDQDIDNMIRKLERKIVVSDPKTIKDFSVIEGTNLTDLDISDSRIFVSDGGNGVVYSFDFAGGDMSKIAENLINPKTISYSSLGELVFVDEDDSRVVGSINLENNQINRYPGVNKARLGNVVNIQAYQVSENDHRLYGVREDTKEVIQMKRTGGSYGLPELRLSGFNLKSLSDIFINEGRIHVVSLGEGVRKFLVQEEIPIQVRGMIGGDNWNNISDIFIDDRYIYAIDNQDKRVLVYTKYRHDNAGVVDYVASYDLSSIQGLDNMVDIVSSRANGAIYVLTRTRVIELKLSDLREFSY